MEKIQIPFDAYVFICLYIICGALQWIYAKYMSLIKIELPETGEIMHFNHPYIQTMFQMGGQLLGLLVYFCTKLFTPKSKQPLPKQIKNKLKVHQAFFLFLIPTACDVISSTLYNVGVYYIQISVHQMLRNFTACWVALWSFCFFRERRRRFDLPQIVGLFVLITGLCTISYSTVMFYHKSQEHYKHPIIGITLVCGGSFFGSMQYISQDYFLHNNDINPYLGVAIEGFWGVLIFSILLPILQYTKSPFTGQQFENYKMWLVEIKASWKLVWVHLAFFFFSGLSDCFGIQITNKTSSAARTTFGSARVIAIWLISFAIGWEQWNAIATPVRLSGFVLVVLGIFFYNNIFKIIPFLKQINKMEHKKRRFRDKVFIWTDRVEEDLMQSPCVRQDNIPMLK